MKSRHILSGFEGINLHLYFYRNVISLRRDHWKSGNLESLTVLGNEQVISGIYFNITFHASFFAAVVKY